MEIRGFSTICHDPLTRLLFNQVNQNITWASNFIKVSIWIFVLHVLPNTLEYNISLLVNKEFLHFFFDLICKYSAKALLLFLFLFHWTRQPKRLFFVKPATFSTIKVTQWLRNFCWFGNPGSKVAGKVLGFKPTTLQFPPWCHDPSSMLHRYILQKRTTLSLFLCFKLLHFLESLILLTL